MPDNISTQLADDARSHELNLLRVEAGMRGEVVAMLDDLEKSLLAQLANEDLTDAKKSHLQKYLNQTQAQVSAAYDQINEIGERNLERVATITSKQTAKSISGALKVDMGTTLSPQQLTAIARGPIVKGNPMADWWNGQSATARSRFHGAVREGLLLGEDMASIQRRVRGTKANNYNDGALAVSRREAQALTRTAVQAVSNQARIDTLKEQDDVVKGIEWLATLDKRTTMTCMALDGKQWRLPDMKPIGHDKAFPGPVAHWGCRSTQTAVLYSWEELAGKKLPKLDGDTFQKNFEKRLQQQGFSPDEAATIKARQRASMDGQVSQSKTWQKWLGDKGDDFAREKLGPSRFALWKAGDLTLTDLTDQRGRVLTLDELEAAIDGGTIPPETEGRDFKPVGAVAKYSDPGAAARAAAKLEIYAEAETAAEKKLQEIIANPEGQTAKAKFAKQAAAELGPGSSFVDQLAWTEAKAQALHESKVKAATLSKAKKKLLAGEEPTPAQKKAISELTEEELANFNDAVADAKGAAGAKLTAELQQQIADSTAAKYDPKKLELLKSIDPVAANMVKGYADQKLATITFDNGVTLIDAGGIDEAKLKIFIDALEPLDPQKAVMLQDHFEAYGQNQVAKEELKKWANGTKQQKEALDMITSGDITSGNLVKKLQAVELYADNQAEVELLNLAANPAGQTVKHKVLADMLGIPVKDLPTTSSMQVAQAMDAQGIGKLQLLADVDMMTAEKKKQSQLASTMSGAKKKFLAGDLFTPAQQDAWNTLTPEQQDSYLDAWSTAKTTQPVAGGDTIQKPDVQPTGPKNLDVQIPDPDGLTKLQDLSGSTRPILAQDPATGKKWVVKDSSRGGSGVEHFQSEALTDAIYRAAGANVPASTVVLKDGGKRAVKVAEFLEGGQTLASWRAGKSKAQIDAMHRRLQDDFVTDALLANWDVAGTGSDNILVLADGTPVRIDNGGGLFFRAQGGKKQLPREIAEMQTLRDYGMNADTAPIFAGITQDQIDDQTVKLLQRRAQILEAASADTQVQKALAARLDWLEEQLPPSKRKTLVEDMAPPSAAGQIPPDIDKRLKTGARGSGTSIVGDGDAIEDQTLRVWKEVAPDGTRLTKVEAQLTLAGSDRIMDTFKAAGIDTATKGAATAPATAAPVVNKHPQDQFWQPIESALKTVGYHYDDGAYNVQTMQAFDAAVKKLNDAIDDDDMSDPQLTAMLKHYAKQVEVLEKMKAKTFKPAKGDLAQFIYVPPATPATGAPKRNPDAVDLSGWEITRKNDLAFTVKEMRNGELHDTGQTNDTEGEYQVADYGRVFQMKKGPVTAYVMAYREDVGSNAIRRSIQGTVRINIDGTDTPAAIESALQTLRAMGIDATPPSDAQKELLYLHKVISMRSDHKLAGYTNALKAGTDIEKVEAVKEFAEKRYNVKLPRQKADWGDDYNPEGKMPSNGTGVRTWQRWDKTQAQIEAMTKDRVLHHSSSNVEEVFLAWVDNAGNATPTLGRIRQGVHVGNKGASPTKDMRVGGGDFLYTNNQQKGGTGTGFQFKGRNLARVDLRSDVGDSYGKWESADSRRGELEQIVATQGYGTSDNTGLLKGGINLFDEIETIKAGNAGTRARMIQAMKDRGFAKWPDGRSLESVIIQ